MFYVLSKTVDLLVAPLTWVLLLVLVAAWGSYRKRATLALRASIAAAVVLYVFSTGIVANAMMSTLEASATTTVSAGKIYDVVVVLGGVASAVPPSPTPEFGVGVDRVLAGYDIVRHDRARYILITSGGEEAPLIANQLADWGIAPERIVVDAQSRNTHDNATESARIIREHGWSSVLLVTSALHMPRAEGCFRATNLEFDTLSVDRVAHDSSLVPARLDPRADSLAQSTSAIREAAGRVIYRAVGYSR